MDNPNRVLIRQGARELTPTEADLVNGGFRTLSVCTANPSPDGDQHVGELGCQTGRLFRASLLFIGRTSLSEVRNDACTRNKVRKETRYGPGQ
jgi:hypothetical protein